MYLETRKFLYKEEELPQKSQDWLDLRKMSLGASEIAILTGDLPKAWDSPYDLFRRKLGIIPPKVFNEAMMRGVKLEPEAREVISGVLKDKLGLKKVTFTQYTGLHPKYPHIIASFDGVDVKNGFILEIKCQSEANFKKILKQQDVQGYYKPQVQQQLLIANKHWGITKAYFCSYYPEMVDGQNLVIIEVQYDEGKGKYITKLANNFYQMLLEEKWNDYWDIV